MTTAPEGRGGYRAPSNPAAVSGPGALSQRTDGGPTQAARYVPGLPYGQGQQTYSNQVAAPMAGNSMAGNPMPAMEMPTELMAPTQRPNEPITAGIDIGEGPGSSALMMQSELGQRKISDILAEMIPYDSTGEIVILYQNAIARGN